MRDKHSQSETDLSQPCEETLHQGRQMVITNDAGKSCRRNEMHHVSRSLVSLCLMTKRQRPNKGTVKFRQLRKPEMDNVGEGSALKIRSASCNLVVQSFVLSVSSLHAPQLLYIIRIKKCSLHVRP